MMNSTLNHSSGLIEAAGRLLSTARRILFITGAGLSADSGLPTYRGVGGLYEGALTDIGLPIEQALSGAMFEKRPDIAWRYLSQIEASCRGAHPNAGHYAIARLEALHGQVTVVTQNVDGFHLLAGSRDVIEMHGTLRRLRCVDCGRVRQVESYAGRRSPQPAPTAAASCGPTWCCSANTSRARPCAASRPSSPSGRTWSSRLAPAAPSPTLPGRSSPPPDAAIRPSRSTRVEPT